MLQKLLTKIVGDYNAKELKRMGKIVDGINKISEGYKNFSDEQLKNKTAEFKERLAGGAKLDSLLPEAFATVREAAARTIKERPYDVQMVGGMVLHEGRIAEMKTGEGKTLAATMPVYLNALAGKGTHVVTVNDYLAKRDAEWMGQIYRFLGMEVSALVHDLDNNQRREAYGCDITYGTNNEFGFDYLRDNMVQKLENKVQRDLYFAIVDEVDSILIDEARTPLIISAAAEESTKKYFQYSQLIPRLQENIDYNVDEKERVATLTEDGIRKMETLLGVQNIYTEKGFAEVHHIEQALKAHVLFKRDRDYVVKDDEIIIVDEFTGRLMPGRRYSEGLHQAIEAKENVEVKRESKTLATISFQNYFRLYDKLAGMTGTALTEAGEFAEIYKLEVIVIPTNKPMVRRDLADRVYKNERGKFTATVAEIKKRHETGQPVLVGTISIEKSEALSALLQREGVPHQVLNAKNHEMEAEIVKDAGQKGAVTIATNMAGRGTDIKLGEGVTDLGGLHILGTERHESRRIDNQLRGRSGRQGDPGSSQFYVSMEDDLMRLFGSERMQKMMDVMKIPEDMPIENKMVSGAIESAQKKVENHHFEIRKHLVEYDDVMNKHREILYARRNKILKSEDLHSDILILLKEEAAALASIYIPEQRANWNLAEVVETIRTIMPTALSEKDLESLGSPIKIQEYLENYLVEAYEKKSQEWEELGVRLEAERTIALRSFDILWMEHIDHMAFLRESVSLHGYAQRDPLIQYKDESYKAFQKLLAAIRGDTIRTLFRAQINQQTIPRQAEKPKEVEQAKENIEEIEGQLTEEFTEEKKVNKVQGTIKKTDPEVGRNDPCPCGSGKKYKKCCGTDS